MTWEEYFAQVRALEKAGRRAEAHRLLGQACHLVSQPGLDRWQWLREALDGDADRTWFAARVFHAQPVPKALLSPMLRAGLRLGDASTIQWFVRPCSETFGAEAIAAILRSIAQEEPALLPQVDKATYWLSGGAKRANRK
jgi:hypothetical protein